MNPELQKPTEAFAKKEVGAEEEVEKKSDFVLACEHELLIAKEKLLAAVRDYQIDNGLKVDLSKLINEHFNAMNFSDYSNASTIQLHRLGDKIFEAIDNFKAEVMGTSDSARYRGDEQHIIREVVNPVMYELGVTINTLEGQRNLKTNEAAVKKNIENSEHPIQ